MVQVRIVSRARERQVELERGRTNGGKVKADAGANVEAGHEGDGAASADEIISHYI